MTASTLDHTTPHVRRCLRVGVGLVVLTVVFAATPARADVTQDQLRSARDEMNQVAADLEAQLIELEEIMLVQTSLETRIEQLDTEIVGQQRAVTVMEAAAREQARSMYVNAGSAPVSAAAGPEGVARSETKVAYLGMVGNANLDAANRLVVLQVDLQRLQDELVGLSADQAKLAADAETLAQQLEARLAEANDRYQSLLSQWQEEEAERQRKAAEAAAAKASAEATAAARAAASQSTYTSSAFVDASGRTCPVAGANAFRDSWMEPREYRNGYHKGTDMVAAAGTPEVAAESGSVWIMNYHWAGGIQLYLRGDSGDVYYYAHMQEYAPGLVEGSRVSAGDLVGYVGNTGSSSVAHLHFGYMPGGGALVNPYQLLAKLCR